MFSNLWRNCLLNKMFVANGRIVVLIGAARAR